MQGPNERGFALQWDIALQIFIYINAGFCHSTLLILTFPI